MPAYISLLKFTDQGIRGVKDVVNRAKAVRQQTEAGGGRIIGIWWTQGQYDGFVIWEAPDDETAAQGLLDIGMRGNYRTETMRAFGEEEMARIVGKLT
jgi:uncharacterized protein with GYD domain